MNLKSLIWRYFHNNIENGGVAHWGGGGTCHPRLGDLEGGAAGGPPGFFDTNICNSASIFYNYMESRTVSVFAH